MICHVNMSNKFSSRMRQSLETAHCFRLGIRDQQAKRLKFLFLGRKTTGKLTVAPKELVNEVLILYYSFVKRNSRFNFATFQIISIFHDISSNIFIPIQLIVKQFCGHQIIPEVPR